MRKSMLAAAAAIAMTGAALADAPAVSKTNLKVTGLAGAADMGGSSESAWSAMAALTAPLGEKWGLQIEAGASGVDGDSAYGAAGHIFRRNPDRYLVGAFAAHAEVSDMDVSATRLGVEGELYFDRTTLLAMAGYQFSDALDDTGFLSAGLRHYATDDLALSLGGAVDQETAAATLGAEWRFAPEGMPGIALRAEAALGDDDYSSVMAGLTVYFGETATLKDRHRKQDPDSALFNLFQGLQAAGSAPVPPPPPPPSMS